MRTMAVEAGVTPPEVRLRDLRPTTSPVEVIGRVISLQRREVTRRTDGSRRPLLSGLLSDGTGTVRFTWWDPPREGVDRGTVLRAVGAEVREFRGRPELTFGFRTRVGPASDAELPRVAAEEFPYRRIGELRPPDEGFRVEARVVRVAERSVTVGDERRALHEGTLADRSGSIAFSSWSDFGLRPGETVRVVGGYLRSFRGRRQLVLDDRATVTRIPPGDLPAVEEIALAPARSIAGVEDAGGGESLAVEGLVVGLLPPSGLVYRCPSCRRTLTAGVCRIHGPVEGIADLRARIVLDDGTGAVTVNAGRADTERLWGLSLADVRARLRDLPDPAVLEQQLLDALLGRRLRVRGAGTQDDFGITIEPESIESMEIDLDAAAGALSARLGSGRP